MSRLFSEMSNASSGKKLDEGPHNQTCISLSRRWRVQLMEKSILMLDFETLDQTVQVHGASHVS